MPDTVPLARRTVVSHLRQAETSDPPLSDIGLAVSEAVTNAVRHGNADEVTVELSNGDGIRLCVVDGGTGFDPSEAGRPGHGFGLTSMRERAEALGGRLTIDSRPGAGTRVEVSLP